INVTIERLSQDMFEITVTDNGPGFPEDVKERLLEPYVTAKEGGTGLGLAIVDRIIMDHGGTISLQSRKDRLPGAQVRISLPVQMGQGVKSEDKSVEYAK
ncbi:MAG: hypothetical protein GYB42_08615, partial [Alphaproteobacteria bacterium]|nr:hypothetical protein [Alphaproteobacteria bacterium]